MMRSGLALLLAVAALGAAFLGTVQVQVAALAAALAVALLVDRRALLAVLRIGVALTILFSSAIAGAVVAWSSDLQRGLDQATTMVLRLLVLVTLTSVLSRNVDSETLLHLTRRLRMERLGLVLGLSLNALPHLGNATRQVLLAWRIRRRTHEGPRPGPMVLLEVLLAHVARVADDAAAAAALRGHSALLQRPSLSTDGVRVIVATGSPGSGKTTAVLELVRHLRSEGQKVSGFVQPGRFENGHKIGFMVRDLVTDGETPLAKLSEHGQGDLGTRFRFDPEGLAAARRALTSARAGDVVVVDELGPLELRGGGHIEAVQQVMRTPGLVAVLLVVRKHLVPSLLEILEVNDALVVDITREEGPASVVSALITEDCSARRRGQTSHARREDL